MKFNIRKDKAGNWHGYYGVRNVMPFLGTKNASQYVQAKTWVKEQNEILRQKKAKAKQESIFHGCTGCHSYVKYRR